MGSPRAPRWRASMTLDQSALDEIAAMLARLGVEYYSRLERGNVETVWSDVLEAVARALRLDEAERAHLFNLIRTANLARASLPRRRPFQQRVRSVVQ